MNPSICVLRGTGGLRIIDEDCATNVPGPYAAGDAARLELICGAFTGGGSHNAVWAMYSGFRAGSSAGGFAFCAGTAGISDGRETRIDA